MKTTHIASTYFALDASITCGGYSLIFFPMRLTVHAVLIVVILNMAYIKEVATPLQGKYKKHRYQQIGQLFKMTHGKPP
jgi:hypothetical protein